MEEQAYLTIADVADELGISKAGVYKLIERGRLKALRRTERGMRVSRLALDAYRRSLQTQSVWSANEAAVTPPTLAQLHDEFVRATGCAPEEWERRWKADEFEDSPENMRLAVRALALRAARQQAPAPSTPPEPWVVAALEQHP